MEEGGKGRMNLHWFGGNPQSVEGRVNLQCERVEVSLNKER